MKREQISSIVIEVINDQNGMDLLVKEESILTDDLGFDSLDNIELIMELEKEFDIQISDDEAEKVKTVKDIVDELESKLN